MNRNDGARADARKRDVSMSLSNGQARESARQEAGAGFESLANWLGDMDEARNIFDCTDEATTVISIDVEELARRLAGVIADAKAEALRSAARALPGFDFVRTHGDAATWLRRRALDIEAEAAR